MKTLEENYRTCIVVNPLSQGGRTERRWGQLAEVIRRHFGPFEYRFTRGPGDGAQQARKAIEEGFELVVAMGGDGTIGEVASGFMDGEQAVRKEAVLGLLPAGTGGDFRRTLDVPKGLAQAAAALRGRKTRTVDLGLVRFTANDGRPA